MNKKVKYIFVTGGVISGLGKGITAASLGFLLSDKYKVVPMKLDGYLNSDPGTMNPIEHGEVFVLDDGFEVDMDFGHYERFIGGSAIREQSLTMGRVFSEIQTKERRGDYLGKTVQMVPHVTNLIEDKIISLGEKTDADVVLVEVGGTVGDVEAELFIEAIRQFQHRVGYENVCFLHLTYVPIPFGVNEQKTKPTQQSVKMLQQRGIFPDFIVARCSEKLSVSVKEKIALFANVSSKDIFSNVDVSSVYRLPLSFDEQSLVERVCLKLGLDNPLKSKLEVWSGLLEKSMKGKVTIAICGKYTDLEDSYASVVESLKHCSYHHNVSVEIKWVDTEKFDSKELVGVSGVIVPGGFGSRGVEGKIEVIKYVREKGIPFLGICYGLQLAVIEFLRNVCGVLDATSMEVSKEGSIAVTLLDEQQNVVDMGGTMRLGRYDAKLSEGVIKELYSKLDLIDSKGLVNERHRHRFEVNPEFVSVFEEKGLLVSGKSVERSLVEFIELPKNVHPYFVATQAHPELKSKLEKPAPLFYGLVGAAKEF